MSFSDPVRIIDHIPQDFDMKANHKRRRYKQPVQPRAEAHTKPFSCERPRRVWTLIAFFGALAIVAGALITGSWSNE